MKVGIITYQVGHLKTWQLVKKLLTKSFSISLYAFPFFPRPQKQRDFNERPYQLLDMDVKTICAAHGIHYVEVGGWADEFATLLGPQGGEATPEVFLTCIAKIIPDSFITGRIIINAHPGLLPENRGVDAFKWAIVNGGPIGISLHAIDMYIDRGVLLHRMKIPVLPADTLRDVAARAYEMECDLQANFDYYLPQLKANRVVSDSYPLSRKRIPDELDRQLESIFLAQREKFVALSSER
jgi:hypothetical protein